MTRNTASSKKDKKSAQEKGKGKTASVASREVSREKEAGDASKAGSSAKTVRDRKENRLKKERDELLAENAVLKDQLLRSAAELDNIRKRTERERVQTIELANTRLILEILPVIDDLERSLKTESSDRSDEFRDGVSLILQKLQSVLKRHGVEPFESVNQPFDVDKHDALLQVDQEGTEPGIVVGEHEKGYLMHGRVLRHAKVLVSK